MKLRSAHPSGWALFESVLHRDDRGWLTENIRIDALQAHAGAVTLMQQNLSSSRRGVLRGLHYQVGSPQGKLVQVLQGRVHDVIVDLRRGSAYFGRSFAVDLRADEPLSIWVPPGFAHGFLALDDCLVLYALTQVRDPQGERTLRWDSPGLGIDWPLVAGPPLLSDRDRAAPGFGEAEVFESAPPDDTDAGAPADDG